MLDVLDQREVNLLHKIIIIIKEYFMRVKK